MTSSVCEKEGSVPPLSRDSPATLTPNAVATLWGTCSGAGPHPLHGSLGVVG